MRTRALTRRLTGIVCSIGLAAGCALVAGCGGSSDDDADGRAGATAATSKPSSAPTTTTTVPTAAALVAAACSGQLEISSPGALASDAMTEISGLAASRTQRDVVWAINDSGNAPQLFAITPDGALVATFVLEGITPIDWEDLALGPGPDPDLDYLYIADTGALLGNREEFAVLRVAEPSVDPDGESRVDEPLEDVETFPVRYPDRGRDNETLLVDPVSGEVLLVHKSWSETGEALVFQVPLDTPGVVATLVPAGAVALMPGEQASAGDVSPAGDAIVLRTYSQVLLFGRPPGTTVTAALASPPCTVPGPPEQQGEAVTFAADAQSLLTVSEGANAALHELQPPD